MTSIDVDAVHQEALATYAKVFEASGIRTELCLPSEVLPLHSLVVQLDGMDLNDSPLTLRMTFVPLDFGPSSQTEAQVWILQSYIHLAADISAERLGQVSALVAHVSPHLAIGSFGLLLGSRTLFYKHNMILPGSPTATHNVRMVDLQCGMMHQSLKIFNEHFESVLVDGQDAVSLISKPPLSHLPN